MKKIFKSDDPVELRIYKRVFSNSLTPRENDPILKSNGSMEPWLRLLTNFSLTER